ncbi:MAG: glycosyltransferase family 2 protein [Dactylosporangium sp.]|nr:glycosyltransferase family 2 protein [Dactylosporangium sp.]
MKVSFVVPTRNSARTLDTCLGSLRAQTHQDVQIVVVDNASTDATVDIARWWADRFADRGPERSAQRNHGLRCATGDVVVFLDSDMVAEPGLAAAIVDRFTGQSELGALVLPERSFGTGFFTRCRVLEKSLYVGDDRVEAPRAFRRDVIEALGGWSESLVAAEDWDLADRTAAAGVGIGRVDAWIWHDEGRLRLAGTFAKKRYYGRWIDHYLALHPDGRRKLVRTALFRRPLWLLRHPLLTAGLFLLKATEALALYLGVRDVQHRRPVPKAA